MKREELIKKLEELPEGTEVVLFDVDKNIREDWGEGSSEGIYPEFETEYHTGEDIKEGSKPFFSIAIPVDEDVVHD